MRIPQIAATAVVAALAATVAIVTPAQAAVAPGPLLLVPAVAAVHTARPTWVKAYWTTTTAICDAKVTVAVANTAVTYPENTGTYTSFYYVDTLAAGEYDYVAFNVTATVTRATLRPMHLTIAYRLYDIEDGCHGPVLDRTYYAVLPIRST